MMSQRPPLSAPTARHLAPHSRQDLFEMASHSDVVVPHPEVVVCDPDPVRAGRIRTALSAVPCVTCHADLDAARHSCQAADAAVVLVPFGGADGPETAATLEFLRKC